MESVGLTRGFWAGRSVLITGHTGFKGGWLSTWLSAMGAKVFGYSLPPPTNPSFFSETDLAKNIFKSTMGDIRDLPALRDAVINASPSIVFHLAAQPLVRESYEDPVTTYATNLMGTVNLLEVLRACDCVRAVVIVTTDKCYENKEWPWPYRESDRLGGYDPYSSSKACTELATAAFRSSFYSQREIGVATVRAGNVIGGGDWAVDRLLPDFFRAYECGKKMEIRSPNAIRPWQHVLEPLAGYIKLAEKLVTHRLLTEGAWNFGPRDSDTKTVSWVLGQLCKRLPEVEWIATETNNNFESSILKLDSSKARSELEWTPRWTLDESIDLTVDWYLAWKNRQDLMGVIHEQIGSYGSL